MLPTTTQTDELATLNRSIDLLLDQVIVLDSMSRRARNLPPGPGMQSLEEMARTYGWDRQTTQAERFAMKLQYDPVREALCQAIRILGIRLHEVGGLRAMQDACDRQEDRVEGSRRVSIVDKRFDGIGEWCA